MTLKAYSLGNNGFVGRRIIEALGEPRHIVQAEVIVIAPSKKAAAELATANVCRTNARELYEAGGWVVEHLLALVEDSAVFVTPLLARTGDPLLRIDEGRAFQLVGQLGDGQIEFVGG